MRTQIEISEAEFKKLFLEFEKRGKRLLAKRREALSPVGDLVASAIAGRAPISDRPHYRYKKGQGKVATYFPGNLRRSIKRLNFRRTKDVWVGPFLDKTNSGGIYSSDTKVDGYYAHFVEYGTTRAPAQPFVATGLATVAPIALRLAVDAMKKLIEK
ncbi:MAG: HK97-gp10 family putative phage morphogenesis protein [candidate division WOR-3 bacterium]